MVVFDANVLSIAIYDDAGIPIDFRTGKPIDRPRERVDALISTLDSEGEFILLPAPALGEALTPVAEFAELYIQRIEETSCFKVHPFGKREAIEIAMRTKAAKAAGDKREGIEEPWQKVKYDRQIIASAKTEGATVIYSTDKHIHAHGKLWGIPVIHLSDVGLSTSGQQSSIFNMDEEADDASKAQDKEITEEQSQSDSIAAASGSTDAPPQPVPNSVATEPEKSAAGGVEQKLGQQASPPSETIVASQQETNAKPTTTQPPNIPPPVEVRGRVNGSPEDQADAEAAQEAEAGASKND